MAKPLLDETLVYATEKELPHVPDFRVDRYRVYRRPHLGDFLISCFSSYDVAVWTSSGSAYADEIVRHIFPEPERLAFLWTSKKCTQRRNLENYEYYWIKDLKKIRKLGYDLEHVLMVDDSPEKLERHYGNHIQVTAFEGNPLDSELKILAAYLESIRDVPNYRNLEKRLWRDQFA